ncbi:Hypothetical predicted protein [Paramuricea clavata]|uniref:Uncharacterized protein n=1 Tax=Paramuricea clavata TaxID=317549 RepID=A0A7D9LM84_PARCT|nr:Hypothetical predicted protein [Paramuricea clavata]
MHDVFLDNERRSRKESEVREKRARQKTREGGKSWEKSIRKEEARRRGIINRERAAEKRRVLEEKKQASREKIRLRDLNETVVQRERRLRRNEYERTRRRKKREAEARYLELTPFREDSAIRGMVERYRIEPTTAFDVLTFLELARPRVRELLDGLRGRTSRNISTNEDRMKSETVQKTSVHELQCISDRFVDDLVAKRDLLKQKGVYPYEYMDDHEKLDMSRLPPKRFFYNGLKMEDVTDEEYERAKKYGRQNFWKESRETYGLDSPWYYTAPGLSWDAALKKTRIKLELITDPRMYRFIENGIRGGISTSVMRYGTADNKYVDISEIPEGIINLMRDLNFKIRKDPTDIREKVLEFENDVCKFLWDYSQEDDNKIMRYIEKNLTRWVTCLSDHGKEDDSKMTEVNPESVPVTKPLDPSKKVKDPRRVEAGKRLAKISQQAKAAKKAKTEKNLKAEVRGECMTEGGSGWISVEKLCLVLGVGIGLGSLYLTWKSRDEKGSVKQVNEIVDDDVEKDSSKDPPKEPFDDLFD